MKAILISLILISDIGIIIYLLVSGIMGESAEYLSPGWHTTIYPKELMWIIITLFILSVSSLVYLMVKGIKRLIDSATSKPVKRE